MLSYSIVVFHLSFNFLCLLLLYSIYLNGFCTVFPFLVCKAQLIGDWYENRRGAPITIIFLLIRQYYWRTDAPCTNRSGGPNTTKILLAHCVWSALPIGEGDIVAPIYWRTDAPCIGRYHTEATSPTQLLALQR